MIVHKDILLVNGVDYGIEGGNVYAVLFEDNEKFGWFSEFRQDGLKPGKGTVGEASRLYDKLSTAKTQFTRKFGATVTHENFSNSPSK